MMTLVSRSFGLTHDRTIRIRNLWMNVTAAFGYLPSEMPVQRRKVYASGLSNEWLRNFAIESAKHLDAS